MRVIAELPYPDFKVTIFSMNRKFIIKLEQGAFEQTYKIAEVNLVGGLDDVFKLIDDDFVENVKNTFEKMRKDFKETYDNYSIT